MPADADSFSYIDSVSISDLNVGGTNNDDATNTFHVRRFCFYRQLDSSLFLLLLLRLIIICSVYHIF